MRRFVLAMLPALALPAAALAQQAPDAPPPAPPGWGPPDAGPADGQWGMKHHHEMPGEMLNKFYNANTTHDGHLTLAQAKAANLTRVVDHFTDIDTANRGYITFNDIEAWRLDDMAKRLEAKATQIRAQD